MAQECSESIVSWTYGYKTFFDLNFRKHRPEQPNHRLYYNFALRGIYDGNVLFATRKLPKYKERFIRFNVVEIGKM